MCVCVCVCVRALYTYTNALQQGEALHRAHGLATGLAPYPYASNLSSILLYPTPCDGESPILRDRHKTVLFRESRIAGGRGTAHICCWTHFRYFFLATADVVSEFYWRKITYTRNNIYIVHYKQHKLHTVILFRNITANINRSVTILRPTAKMNICPLRSSLRWLLFSNENMAAPEGRLATKQIRFACHFGHAWHTFLLHVPLYSKLFLVTYFSSIFSHFSVIHNFFQAEYDVTIRQ